MENQENNNSAVENQETETALSVAECEVLAENIVCYYGQDGVPDVRDIVVYVRERFPNPYQRVLIKTDLTLTEKDLLDQLIFIDGVNNEELAAPRGIGLTYMFPFCVNVDKGVDGNGGVIEDYGLVDTVAAFVKTYGVTSFEVLVYGYDLQAVASLWEWVQSSGTIHYDIIFPASVSKMLRIFKNGIDIAPYVKRLESAVYRNDLTTSFLRKFMDELRSQVRAGKTAIQNCEDTRSAFAQWITLVLTQEFDLSPVYISSYITEYVEHSIAYPFDKLSLYERINFVHSLPADVGYIGKNQGFRCLYHIISKIYPKPALAFNLVTGEAKSEGLDDFDIRQMQIYDYRSQFPGSRSYFVEAGAGGLTAVDKTDEEVDKKLTQIFFNMMQAAEKAGVENAYLTVRNTLFVKFHGVNYILYFDEPLGLVGSLQSEYFGAHPMVVGEEDFTNLIDAKIILALRSRDANKGIAAGNSAFTDIIVRAASTFKPAIPAFVLMCCELTTRYGSELSYYDARLRCDKNIVPIVTHDDSDLKQKRTLFSYLTMNNIMSDEVAARAVTCFGTLNASKGFTESLPVSITSFKGSKLL